MSFSSSSLFELSKKIAVRSMYGAYFAAIVTVSGDNIDVFKIKKESTEQITDCNKNSTVFRLTATPMETTETTKTWLYPVSHFLHSQKSTKSLVFGVRDALSKASFEAKDLIDSDVTVFAKEIIQRVDPTDKIMKITKACSYFCLAFMITELAPIISLGVGVAGILAISAMETFTSRQAIKLGAYINPFAQKRLVTIFDEDKEEEEKEKEKTVDGKIQTFPEYEPRKPLVSPWLGWLTTYYDVKVERFCSTCDKYH